MPVDEPTVEQDGIGITIRGRGPVSRSQAVGLIDQVERIVRSTRGDNSATAQTYEVVDAPEGPESSS